MWSCEAQSLRWFSKNLYSPEDLALHQHWNLQKSWNISLKNLKKINFAKKKEEKICSNEERHGPVVDITMYVCVLFYIWFLFLKSPDFFNNSIITWLSITKKSNPTPLPPPPNKHHNLTHIQTKKNIEPQKPETQNWFAGLYRRLFVLFWDGTSRAKSSDPVYIWLWSLCHSSTMHTVVMRDQWGQTKSAILLHLFFFGDTEAETLL